MTPYWPPRTDDPPYWCPLCSAWYTRVQNVSCCVLHGPGTCCHLGEQKADPQPPAPKRVPA